MSKKLIFLLLAAVWVAVPSAVASLKYDTLTSADGLSNSSVNCIYQDSTLMMWFGTWDGLNAYNGYGFRTYKFAPDNANTISNNVIRNIVEEAKGILWVATDYGINRIDVENDRIERFYPGYEDNGPTAEQVFSVAAAADGTIFCAATGWGIACYDKALGRLSALNVPQFNSSEIRAVYYGGQNTLLLHTVQEELVRIRYGLSATGSMEVREKVGLFPEGGVKSVFDSRTALYLVTADAEIYRYERRDGELAAVGKFPPPAREIRAVAQYGDDYLLIATGAPDMYVCDMPGRTFHRMSQMPDINILSLCYGSQDILWVGSDGQGVFQVYNDGIQFDKIPNSRIFGDRNCPVRAFCEDSRGNVYVATKGNGIGMLRPDESRGAVYDVSGGLGNNSVYALAGGFGDDLFIGHDGAGLDVLSCATGRISSIKPVPGTYFGSVYAIYRDPSDGCVWLGTNGYGLIGLQLAESGGRYEIRRQRVYVNDKKDATSLSNNTVFAIVPAGGGKLWVGTRGGGLNLFDTRSGKFTHYTTSSGDYPISSNDILSLYAGRDSTLWIGTSYGLNRLSPTAGGRGGFRWYIEKDGLPNNTIHGILEDDSGNLWLSTNKGLAQLNPGDNRIISYYNNEELQSNEFSDGAYYRSRDGRMYFGGVAGFNRFDPRDIRVRTYAPAVQLNNFLIKQTPVPGFRADREIVLSHSENFFSIQFSALEYIRNGNCEYAYILKGFNDDWVDIGTDNTAVFTNVPPGAYEFCVRCTNGDKIWSGNTASLHIRVRPPWWNTVWAYMVYLLLFFVVLYIVWFVGNQLAVYTGIPLTFLVNGFLMRRIRISHLYSFGMLLSGVSMAVMMSLETLDLAGIVVAGLIMGLSYGFFWANRDFLALNSTDDGNRNYYYGLESFFNTVAGVVVPGMIGAFLGATADHNWLGGNINLAYKLVTLFVFVLTIIASAVVFRGRFSNPPKERFIYLRFDVLWNRMMRLAVLKGIAQGYIVTAPSMLVMTLVGNESTLGTLQSVSAIVSAVLLYLLGRFASARHRVLIFSSGLLLFALGGAFNAVLYSATGAIVFMLCLVMGRPLMDLGYFPIQLRVIDYVSRKENRNSYAYIFVHEFALYLGRFFGCGLFIVLTICLSDTFAIRYALLIIGIIQLVSIGISRNITRALDRAEAE